MILAGQGGYKGVCIPHIPLHSRLAVVTDFRHCATWSAGVEVIHQTLTLSLCLSSFPLFLFSQFPASLFSEIPSLAHRCASDHLAMDRTPREVHDRIYREAIGYIREFSEFPYIAYTEHLSALVCDPSLST